MSHPAIRKLLFAAFGLSMLNGAATAGPLQEATLSKIINNVNIVNPDGNSRPAALEDVIKDDIGVKTGVKSRAELLFQDQTLTRLGPETLFSFKTGTRDLTLDQGTMLLQVPKGLGGAKIRTAALTASITGTTIMIEYQPKNHVKIIVLEGSLRLSVNGRVGEAVLLTPGKMIVASPEAKSLPEPVDVDLGHLVKTSTLVNSELFGGAKKSSIAPLPSIGLIQKEIAAQQTLKNNNSLIGTHTAILGSGTRTTTVTDKQLAMLDEHVRVTTVLKINAAESADNSSDETSSLLTSGKTNAKHQKNGDKKNKDDKSKEDKNKNKDEKNKDDKKPENDGKKPKNK